VDILKKRHYLSVVLFLFLLTALYIPYFGSSLLPDSKPTVIEARTSKSALQGEFHLSNVVKIYIPSTTHESKPIPEEQHEEYIDNALEIFSKMFGGATAIDGKGAWLNDQNRLVKEDVTIVYSFTSKLNNKTIDEVVAYAKKIKNELSQSSVSLEVNGKMYFIE
jgi:hypothetical protein